MTNELDSKENITEVGRWILFHKPQLFRRILLHDE